MHSAVAATPPSRSVRCGARLPLLLTLITLPMIPATAGPLPPQAALHAFRTEPGLRVELVAAEPLVESPVALAFDAAGHLFVAENRGYPLGPGTNQPPAGRIVRLEDTDRDGTFERRTVFAEGLTFPNGLLPWRHGVIVTCAPDVLWLQDRDGDGRADERRVLLTGFSIKGSTQLRVSHPTLGPDGWVYLTSGLMGGRISAPAFPDRPPLDVGRIDVRFRPDTGEFEAADGGSQFGLTFDDAGNRFICYNRVQAQQVVLESRHLRRHPGFAFSETVQNLPEAMVPEPLRGHGAAARIFPVSEQVTTADSHAGTFTAACGVFVFRGTALPSAYAGAVFSCEPTGNLVHADALVPSGASFVARRIYPTSEFLASTDTWFRPVFLASGPDGALYVCDMYRQTIEHPDYLPEEVRKRTHFEGGKGLGRIWRVRGENHPVGMPAAPDFRRANLVPLLDHPNGWHRDTAFRLLVEDPALADAPMLRDLTAALVRPASAAGTCLQLRALSLLGPLPDPVLADHLQHAQARVRETAIRLSAIRLATNTGLLDRVLERASDPDAHVRFQTALALGDAGFSPPPDADPAGPTTTRRDAHRLVTALATIARHDAPDRWARAAIISSAFGHEETLVDALLQGPDEASAAGTEILLTELGRTLASRPPQLTVAVRCLTGTPRDTRRRIAFLAGYADGLQARGRGSKEMSALGLLLALSSDSTVSERLDQLFEEARARVFDASLPPPTRLGAILLLAQSENRQVARALLPILDQPFPPELQAAAVRAIALPHHASIIPELVTRDRWASATAPVRAAILGALLARSEFVPPLLEAIRSGAIPPSALDSNQRQQLLRHKDESLRAQAGAILSQAGSADRMKVFEALKEVLRLEPDPAHGRQVFERSCAACHRLDRVGVPVGPDLFSIRNQPKEAILLHTIVPDHEIMPGFANYTVETRDGRSLSGLIASESATSVTLRRAQGEEETILRTQIVSLTASRLSLMPQELETTMSRQELADLLAFLKGENAGSITPPR